MWQGNITIFPAFTTTDVDKHASTIHMWDLKMGALLQAQPTGVDRGEADSVAGEADTAEHPSNLFEAEDHRQLLLAWGSNTAEGGPVAVESRLEEELDAAKRDSASTAGVIFDILDVEEVLSKFFLGDSVWGFAIVLRSLAHGPDVHLRRTFRQAPALKALDPSLAKLGHGYPSFDWGDGSHRKYRSPGLATE
jgi:hypothetical protein